MNTNFKYLLRGGVVTILTMSLLQSCKKEEVNSNNHLQTINGVIDVNTVNDSFFVSSQFAMKVAERLPADYMTSQHNGHYTEVVRSVDSILPLRFEGDTIPAAYVVNYSNNEGYVIISADARYEPILSFTNQGNLSINDTLPSMLVEWIGHNMENVEMLRNNLVEGEDSSIITANDRWQDIYTNWDINAGLTSDDNNYIRPVGRPYDGTGPQYGTCTNIIIRSVPLLTKWGQGVKYNDSLEYMGCTTNYSNGKPPVGCVATATAQILKYWNHSAGFGNNFNFSSMPTGDNSNNQVQKLMRDLGKPALLDMDYSCNGSGAYSTKVKTTLKNHFGYGSPGNYKRYDVNTNDFYKIVEDIDNGQVVYLDGSMTRTEKKIFGIKWYTFGDGHAWLCDGYKIIGKGCNSETKYLKMNWGWGGDHDEFYYENNWSIPNTNYNFKYDREFLYKIHP